MGDQDGQDPKRNTGKRKAAEDEDGESLAVLMRAAVTDFTRQCGGGDGILEVGPGIPAGQDAPLLVNQPHGQQQPGVAPGASTSRREALLPPQAQGGPSIAGASGPLQIRGTGNSQLQPMGSLPQPPLLPQYSIWSGAPQQTRDDGYWRTMREVSCLCQNPVVRRQFQDRHRQYKEAHPSPIPEDQRCQTCRYYEKRVEDLPYRHDCPCDVCIALYVVVCLVCTLPPAAAPAGMGLPGQDQRPVGQRGVAASGGSAAQAQLRQPNLQPGQQARPVLPAGQPVGVGPKTAPPRPHRHPQPPPPVGAGVQQPRNQLAVATRPVGHHGEVPAFPPVPEHLRCPFCHTRPGGPAPRSPQHPCLCDTCRSNGVVCHVCASSQGGV